MFLNEDHDKTLCQRYLDQFYLSNSGIKQKINISIRKQESDIILD